MNNMEAQYIVDPEDRAKIRPATKLIVAIEVKFDSMVTSLYVCTCVHSCKHAIMVHR